MPISSSICRFLRIFIARLLSRSPGNSLFVGPPRKILNSTPDYIKIIAKNGNHDISFYPLQPKEFTSRQPPFYADNEISLHFDRMDSGIIKEQFVVNLVHGRYWGRAYGYIINNDDCIHRDLSPSFEDITYDNFLSYRHDALNQPFLPPIRHVKGTVAALNTPFSTNFHHWLLDCVPKFGLLESAGFDLDNIDYFILPPFSFWHDEILHLLKIPQEKLIASSPKVHIVADNLIVPSFSEPSQQPHKFNYTPQGLDYVRKLVLHKSMPLSFPEKILISREKTTSRRLLNSETINKYLEREGFVKIILEDYSLAEQAMIFHSAKTIIMPTGGGLANLVFCSRNTKVIELFSSSYLPTFSLLLANHLDLQYIALVGQSLSGASEHSSAGNSEDINIPTDRLLAFATD